MAATPEKGTRSAERALLEPPDGQVIHGWGQISGQWTYDDPASAGDEADLVLYEKAVAPHRPATISFYIAPVEKHVSGFEKKYPAFAANRPFFIAQIGLYFLDRELQEAVSSGQSDDQVRRLFLCLKQVGRPVLLRIGHEFNGHEAAYDPALYIPAFRRVAKLARETAPGLIATVWSAEPMGFADRDYMDWYPGNTWVDWWGLSLFFSEYMTDTGVIGFVSDAARRRKPILIGESSPWFHGDQDRPVRGPESAQEAKQWYESLFGFISAHPNVKAASIVIVDWTRWNSYFPNVPGGFPDVRLSRWPNLESWYKDRIASACPVDAATASLMFASQ